MGTKKGHEGKEGKTHEGQTKSTLNQIVEYLGKTQLGKDERNRAEGTRMEVVETKGVQTVSKIEEDTYKDKPDELDRYKDKHTHTKDTYKDKPIRAPMVVKAGQHKGQAWTEDTRGKWTRYSYKGNRRE